MCWFQLFQFILFATFLLLEIKLGIGQILNPILECDFEKELACVKTQDKNDDFDWIYGRGPTEAEFTGPDFDNTFRNATGTYLYIKSDRNRTGTVATIRMTSQGTITQGWARIVFAYHMLDNRPPDRLGTLRLQACGQDLWSRTGNQSRFWLKAAMTFQCDQTRPEIVFQGIRGGVDSDIAIDDIFLFDVEGPVFTTQVIPQIPTNATLIGNPPGLDRSMIALIITFSVIGFLILVCVLSTLLRRCMRNFFETFDFPDLLKREQPKATNQEADDQYMALNGQKVADIYMGVDTTGVQAHNSTANDTTGVHTHESTAIAGMVTGTVVFATSTTAAEQSQKNVYAKPMHKSKQTAAETGDYLQPSVTETSTESMETGEYLCPVKRETGHLYESPPSNLSATESVDYLEPKAPSATGMNEYTEMNHYIEMLGPSLIPLTTETEEYLVPSFNQVVTATDDYLEPSLNQRTTETGDYSEYKTDETVDYLQPMSANLEAEYSSSISSPDQSSPDLADYGVVKPLSVDDTYAEVKAATAIDNHPKLKHLPYDD